MRVHCAWTERLVTPRTEAERAHGIMALRYGTPVSRRGGSGSPSDAETTSSPAKFESSILLNFFKSVARPPEDYLYFWQECEVENLFLRHVYELSSKGIGEPEF